MLRSLVFAFCLLVIANCWQTVRYDNHQIWNIQVCTLFLHFTRWLLTSTFCCQLPKTQAGYDVWQKLQSTESFQVRNRLLEVFGYSTVAVFPHYLMQIGFDYDDTHVRILPEKVDEVAAFLRANNVRSCAFRRFNLALFRSSTRSSWRTCRRPSTLRTRGTS